MRTAAEIRNKPTGKNDGADLLAVRIGVGHPQEIMYGLGITYSVATPQSIADQWWFWNCKCA